MNKSTSQLNYIHLPFNKLGAVAEGSSRLCDSPYGWLNRLTADSTEARLEGSYCSLEKNLGISSEDLLT